jgi:hypothetical protein
MASIETFGALRVALLLNHVCLGLDEALAVEEEGDIVQDFREMLWS